MDQVLVFYCYFHIHSGNMKHLAILPLLGLLAVFQPACSPYGNAVNKAFVKPLEKRYLRAQRHADRNYPDTPYLLQGVLLDGRDSTLMPFTWVSIHFTGLSSGVMSNEQGEFSLQFADSVFVKNRLHLKVYHNSFGKVSVEVPKKAFKGNEARLNVFVPVPEIRLD